MAAGWGELQQNPWPDTNSAPVWKPESCPWTVTHLIRWVTAGNDWFPSFLSFISTLNASDYLSQPNSAQVSFGGAKTFLASLVIKALILLHPAQQFSWQTLCGIRRKQKKGPYEVTVKQPVILSSVCKDKWKLNLFEQQIMVLTWSSFCSSCSTEGIHRCLIGSYCCCGPCKNVRLIRLFSVHVNS